MPTPDAGTELRKALGLPEPNYGPGYKNPSYFGGFRNREDERDFAELDARIAAEPEFHVADGRRIVEAAA